jgi:hypothetical protein
MCVADESRRTESAAIDALVESIIRDAKLPSASERDALRRELIDHFEDAGDGALERFGRAESVAGGFRAAYRRSRTLVHLARLVAVMIVALSFALLLQLPINLELERGQIVLTHWYVMAVPVSLFTVVAAIAAWELGLETVCVRLERDPVRMLAASLALFVVIFTVHTFSSMPVTPAHAFLGASALLAVWTSTLAVLSRADRVLLRLTGGDL